MSTTVYGCINPATGAITFASLEDCLSQASCEVVAAGAHAGQVALTLSDANQNEDCNDTFYGCINKTDGKFQVVIPEDCCYEIGANCECFAEGNTPKYYTVNVYREDWGSRTIVLTQTGGPCRWEGTYAPNGVVAMGCVVLGPEEDNPRVLVSYWDGSHTQNAAIRFIEACDISGSVVTPRHLGSHVGYHDCMDEEPDSEDTKTLTWYPGI